MFSQLSFLHNGEGRIFGSRILDNKYFRSVLWNIYRSRFVIFPINFEGNHWIVGIAETAKLSLTLYDSLGNSKRVLKSTLSTLKDYLQREHLAKQGTTLPENWKFVIADVNERQRDGSSCGVFVCRYVELLIEAIEKRQVLSPSLLRNCFVEESINEMRKRICKILSQQLLDQRRRTILQKDIARRNLFAISSIYNIQRHGCKSLIFRLPSVILSTGGRTPAETSGKQLEFSSGISRPA